MEYRNEESGRQCLAQYQAIVDYNLQLKIKMLDDSANVTKGVGTTKLHIYASDSALQLRAGMRMAQASDANKLKGLAGQLASATRAPIPVDQRSRTRHGFNHNETGRLLIPIDYLMAYDMDPAKCVSKISTLTY